MKNIRAIIFDIDGTIADSLGIWAEADSEFLRRRGIEYNPALSAAMKSMHFMSAAQYIIDVYGLKDSLESAASEITDIVRQKYFHEVKLMPMAHELMDHCIASGIKICAATSNSRELAAGVLENNGILSKMEFIITSDEAGSAKDNPDIFFMCSKKLGIPPENIAVVEDSPHAAKTAMESGFFTIGVNSGYFGDFEALKSCTHMRVKSLGEIIGCLEACGKECV